MTTINLRTEIDASINVCFDLARDIDVHIRSTGKTNEKAIAGRLKGLCEKGDTITWEAKHFVITQQLSVEITRLEKPFFFEDRMLKGAFKSMRHEHHFEELNGCTIMKDHFEYEVPYSVFGRLFNIFVLKSYMTRFLLARNKILKSLAENRSAD
ncbi:MAG: SRPBCC family protein [Bacteroidia bacterium]